ncbi:DJ-1/PfpI family protein [Paenibacillus sp. GSMTC-2017]|uniref:DJ-1/PfpI family protein n=1 Tax=Paenibacillus sp. GSMTC-2017 TaxID=2794350 RepID=UPI0018D97C23|nr:DJ-1/PfpI family protein [Paenibacillus sp. GSMTC-2017]MBH5320429.1 DJ-1/PfpI family protein [Paenibacillus sp. GSMTC-2017]
MKKTCLLLPNGFEAYEASVFTDVIGWNKLQGDGSTELVAVGTRAKLTCTFNFTVLPEKLLSDVTVDEFDALALPGGFESAGFYEDAYRPDVLAFIREFDRQGKYIASICVGALPIGKSGALEGRTATTYNLNNRMRQTQLTEMGVNVIPDQPIVIDRNIITSFNPSTALDVAFLLLEKLTSTDNANHVKRLMGVIK